MNSLDTEFHRRLLKHVTEMQADKMQSLRQGALEPPAYKYECGYLKALDDIEDWCGEIEKQLTEGK